MCDWIKFTTLGILDTMAATLGVQSPSISPISQKDIEGKDCYTELFGKPSGKSAETSFGTTYYELKQKDTSSTGPLMILIHDLGGSTAMFDAISEKLMNMGYRVLSYDLYDHGYSQTDADKYNIQAQGIHPLLFSMKLQVQQLQDLLHAIKLENEDCWILGHGVGGRIAVSYAATHPDAIKGLFLVNASCFPCQRPLGDDCFVKLAGTHSFSDFSTNACRSLVLTTDKESYVKKQRLNAGNNNRFFSAMASMNEFCNDKSTEIDYRFCCTFGIPIHLIWAKGDKYAPYDHCAGMRELAQASGTEVSQVTFRKYTRNFIMDYELVDDLAMSISFHLPEVTNSQNDSNGNDTIAASEKAGDDDPAIDP